MFNIRHALKVDYSYWFTLDEHISQNEFEHKIREKQGYIICDGDKPIGLMRYGLFWDLVPFLNLIELEESYRGKGIGKQAMNHWENEMCNLGYKLVMTSSQADEQAQHFYRKLGYKDSGCLMISNKEPLEVFFVKQLKCTK